MKHILEQLAVHGLQPTQSTVKGVARKLGANLVSTWGRLAIVDFFITNKNLYL